MISLAWLAASVTTLMLVTRLPYRPTWAMVTALAVVLTADLALNNGPNELTALPRKNFTMLDPDEPNETIRIIKSLAHQPPGSPRRDRVELAGLGFDWPNAAMVHGFDHTLGYNPLRLADFTRAVGAGDSIIGPDQRKFTALFPSYHCRLANLLGLRYIVSPIPVDKIDHRMKPTDLRFMARTPDGYLYENTEALPRVLFVHNWQIADFGRIMRDGKWPPADPRYTVLLDQRPNVPLTTSLEYAGGMEAAERAHPALRKHGDRYRGRYGRVGFRGPQRRLASLVVRHHRRPCPPKFTRPTCCSAP